MGHFFSKIYCDDSDWFIDENTCSSSSECWDSYQMDLNIVMILDESLKTKIKTSDIDVVNIDFKCSNCDSNFQMAIYYLNDKFYRQYGNFRRIISNRESTSLNISHDSLKPILDKLREAKKLYTSKEYAHDLFYAVLKEKVESVLF